MKKIITIIGLALTLALTSMAQPVVPAPEPTNAFQRGWDNVVGWTRVETGDLYKSGETHLDLSGTYTAAEPGGIGNLFKNDFTRGVWGVDIGLSYYPSKYLGLGADVVVTDINNPSNYLIDELNVNAILRYPINRVAPYAIASVGRNFESGLYSFQAGPGIEFRVNRSVGLFADARFQWQMDSRNDQLLTRAGLRFNF